MEIGKPQLARLVLGYLKNENCTKAFNEFLTTSKYLTQHAVFVKNGKYFATRVGGQTLEDIINEYTEISLIIQGKLEQTSYYEEKHKMNLVGQLKYILDYDSEPSPILSNDLNTTPSESLPGNSSPKSTPKHSNNQVTPTFGECSPIECLGNISHILSQTLLEKPELHEKLADAINSVRKSSKGKDCEVENASDQLDEKIRTIVQKAEEDPFFNDLLGEIIGNKSDLPDHSGCKSSQSSNTEFQKTSTSKSNEANKKRVVQTVDKVAACKKQEKEPIKALCSTTETTSIHHGSTSTNLPSSSIVPSSSTNSNSEVLIFNGNLDSYVGKSSSILPAKQSQIYVTNTPGVLMLPPMVAAPNYFFVNSQPNQVSSVLTDSDIMKMPTVILDEGPTQNRIEDNITNIAPVRRCKAIVPKSDNITVSTVGSGEYLAVYNDDGQVVVHSSGGEEAPPAKKPTSKSTPKPILRKKLHRQAKKKKQETIPEEEKRKSPTTPIVKSEVKKLTPKSSSHVRTLDFTTPTKNASEIETEEQCIVKKVDTAKRKTPKNVFKQEKKNEKKSTSSAWDAELRELLIPRNIMLDSPDTSNENIDPCEDDDELRNQAMLIEAAFKTPSKNDVENKATSPDKPAVTPTKEQQLKENVTEEESAKKEDGSVETMTVIETQLYLRNCNAPHRFRKKCNASNNILQTCEVEVVLEKNETIEKQISEHSKLTAEMSVDNVETRRNIILETPIKGPPKTPGKCELTPFSRELEEQIRGIDLLSLPTPNLPITPSFSVTPCIDLNTPAHANRPTDYSTSSSYYQPSDTEQNKSLEVMIEECEKLAKRCGKVNEKRETEEDKCENQSSTSTTNDIKRIFNQSVIGKKNLNLMKRLSSSDSSDDSDSSYSSSDSSSSNSYSEHEPSHGEDASKKDTYCLRRRTVTPKADEKVSKSAASAKAPKKIKSVAEEIIDKRERVLKFLKSDDKNSQKPSQKINQTKVKSCKTIKKPASQRKSRSPVKKPLLKTSEQVSKLFDVENEITDDDFALHLSTDEDTTNKLAVESSTAKEKEDIAGNIPSHSNKATPSDLEAEQLVQGLKERGIHLVHKKSPSKNDSVVVVTKNEEVDAGPTRPNSEHDGASKKETRQVISKIGEQEIETKEMNIPTSENTSSLNMSGNDSEVIFDIEFFGEDRQCVVDYSNCKKKSKKTIYDSKVLMKEMKANVYIESLDTEMERIIKCTPFDVLLDIVSKSNVSKTKKKSVKTDTSLSCPPSESQVNIERKLNICDIKEIIPESKNSTGSKVKTIEKKPSLATKKQKSDLPTSSQKPSLATKKEKSDLPTSSHKSKTASKKGGNGSEECAKIDSRGKDCQETKEENIISSALSFKVSSDVNRTSEKDSGNNKEKVLNIQWGQSPVLRKEDDELMNYAILGSQREENSESPKSGNKRKYSSSEEGEPMEKKCKTEQQQALLKKIDVDMFLNKVHGNAEKAQL